VSARIPVQRRQKMNSINKTAGIGGVVYILETGTGILSLVLTRPVLGCSDFPASVSLPISPAGNGYDDPG
jgi:hypothetical protein